MYYIPSQSEASYLGKMESHYSFPELADLHLVLGEGNENASNAIRRSREKCHN
jgi:hypothetical protein